jgi:excisionase family DNA binding protein
MDASRSELLDVKETARLLGVSRITVYRACADGRLPTVRLNPRGAIRIPREALMPKEQA